MGARIYIPTLGRFTSVDPVEGGAPNRYAYATEPVNSVDLDGRVVETALDVALVAYSANEFKNNKSLANGAFLAFDIAATAVPFLPASGVVRAGAKTASNYSKKLENGRIREYGPFKPASKAGEMAGARKVKEINSKNNSSRYWYETLDHNNKVRRVRSFDNKGYRHYDF